MQACDIKNEIYQFTGEVKYWGFLIPFRRPSPSTKQNQGWTTKHRRFRKPCCSVPWGISSHFSCTFPAMSLADILQGSFCFSCLRPHTEAFWPYLNSSSDFLKVVTCSGNLCTCGGQGCVQQQWLVPSSEELLNAHCKLRSIICLLENSCCYSPEDTGMEWRANMFNNQACRNFGIFFFFLYQINFLSSG